MLDGTHHLLLVVALTSWMHPCDSSGSLLWTSDILGRLMTEALFGLICMQEEETVAHDVCKEKSAQRKIVLSKISCNATRVCCGWVVSQLRLTLHSFGAIQLTLKNAGLEHCDVRFS